MKDTRTRAQNRHFEWNVVSSKPERRRASEGGLPGGLLDELEPLHAEFSARVVETPLAGLDLLVAKLLAKLGRLLGAERTAVFELSDDRRGFRPWQAWTAPGAERLPKLEVREGFAALGELLPRSRGTRLVLPLQVGGASLGAHVIDGMNERLVTALRPLHGALAMALLRRRAEREHARQQSELDQVERLAGSGHWTHNFATGSSRGSAQLLALLRLDPRAELELRASMHAIHPDDRDTYEVFLTALLEGHGVDPIEVRARYADGEVRNLRCWGEISRTANGEPRLARGVVRDVTELRSHEQTLTALSHRLIRAHEEERARVAREIHDDLGQRLAALKLEIDLLSRDAEHTTPAELLPRLRELMDSADEVTAVARGLSHALHPVMLQQVGLAAAVEALCLRTTMLSEVEASFEPGEIPETLEPEVALCLYRVAQEALGNVTRHSQANTATVSLGCHGEQLVLSVRDDGVGMSGRMPSDAAPGLGLLAMQERMHLARGSLAIASTPGAGTCVTARVPLSHRRAPGTASER